MAPGAKTLPPTGCATSFTSSVKWHESILRSSCVSRGISELGLKKRIRLGESYQLPLSFTFIVSPMRNAAVGFPRRLLFPQPGSKGDKRWLPLALAVIASDSDTRDLEHPGDNAGHIAGPEVADAFDHLHKHFGGRVFRCGTIGYAGSNRAKYPGQESPIERSAPRVRRLAHDQAGL